MNNRMNGISMPGLQGGAGFPAQSESDPEPTAYKIPPAIWMVIFLIIGYVGVRMLIED